MSMHNNIGIIVTDNIIEGIMNDCIKQEKLSQQFSWQIIKLQIIRPWFTLHKHRFPPMSLASALFDSYFKMSVLYSILINSTQLYCSNLYMSWFENAFRVKDHKIPFLNWINLQCKIVAGSISKTWTGSILPKSFFLSSYGFCVADHPA